MARGDSGGAGAGVLGGTEDNSVNRDETRLSLDGLSTDSFGDAVDQVGTESPVERPWISGNLENMKSFAWHYYTDCYKANPVEPSDIEAYLDTITFEKVLIVDEQQSLTDPITLDELLQQASCSTKATAPGL